MKISLFRFMKAVKGEQKKRKDFFESEKTRSDKQSIEEFDFSDKWFRSINTTILVMDLMKPRKCVREAGMFEMHESYRPLILSHLKELQDLKLFLKTNGGS